MLKQFKARAVKRYLTFLGVGWNKYQIPLQNMTGQVNKLTLPANFLCSVAKRMCSVHHTGIA